MSPLTSRLGRNVDGARTRRGSARPGLIVFGLGAAPCLTGAADAQLYFPTDDLYTEIVSADFNRDGWADLALFAVGGKMSIFLSAGGGAYEDPVNYQVGYDSADVAVADLNGDYAPDMVVGMRRGPGIDAWIKVVLNQGDGSFDTEWSIHSIGMDGSPRVSVGDFDGDGDIDTGFIRPAPLLSSDFLYWLENDGDGRFDGLHQSRPELGIDHYGHVVGDFDDDGDADVALTSRRTYGKYDYQRMVYIMLNEGTGQSFQCQSYNLPNATHEWDSFGELDAGDFDGDGDLDLVVPYNSYSRGGRLHIASNDGLGVFDFVLDLRVGNDSEVSCADVDGDADIDILLPNYEPPVVRVMLNNGQGSAFRLVNLDVGGGAYPPAVTDMNDDGLFDLVTGGNRWHDRGLYVTLNPLQPDRPRLRQAPLVPGQSAWFEVGNATPGADVRFFYTLDGLGSSCGMSPFGGVILDLAGAVVEMGAATADQNGVARITRTIPPTAPYATLVTQSVSERSPGSDEWTKSNFITAPIRD